MRSKKRSTSHDVTCIAGVSRTTVSFVLNRLEGVSISENTRQRVWEAAEKLNYHPNAAGRWLVSGKSSTFGLVLYQSPEEVFADAFLPRVILGLDDNPLCGYGMPVESSDLNTYLCNQMDTLATMAQALGLEGEAAIWRRRAQSIVRRMMEDFWDEDAGLFQALHDEQPIPVISGRARRPQFPLSRLLRLE